MEAKEEEEVIRVMCSDGVEMTMDPRLVKLSGFFQSLEDREEIVNLKISSEIMKKIIEFYDFHDFNPPETKIKYIKYMKLDKIMSEKNYKFFKEYTNDTIKPLLIASHFLDLKNLYKLCIISIGRNFYIEPQSNGFERAKVRLKVNKKLT